MALKDLEKTEGQTLTKIEQVAGDHTLQFGQVFGNVIINLPDSLVPPAPDPARPITDGKVLPCPYRGLFTFRPEHADLFFGRTKFTAQLVRAAERQPFVAVLGASGSGKSSVVFAGLVPALLNRSHDKWHFTTFRPGDDPFLSLAGSLIPILEPDLSKTKQIAEARDLATRLYEGRAALTDYLSTIHQTEPDHKLLIIADQFEEVYTLCPNADVRHKFLDSLLDVVSVSQSVASHLVLTLRADFLGQASLFSPLAERLNGEGAAHILGPMGRTDMVEAIEEPARLRGIRFEDKLVDRLLDDVGQEEGNLPLLEFTLTELWQHQRQGYLTHVAYEQIGGVKGALSRHADKVYSRLTSTGQTQARYILGQLVKPGLGGENPRRRVTQSELATEWPLVIKLTNERLLLTNKVGQAEETVEIVHEILVRHWGQLRTWIDEDRTQLLIRHRLSDAAKEWNRHNRSKDYLYRAAQLSQVNQIWPAIKPSPLENEFVEASREAERAKRRAKNWARVWRVTAGVVTVLLVATVAGVIWQIQQARSPWQLVDGFPADSVLALSLTAETPPSYYAGTANIGVVRSQGEGWNILRAGLPTGPPADNDPSKNVRAVGQVTADPLNPGRLYAPVMGNGIFRSEDYGGQWERVSETDLPAGDDDVAVDLAVHGDLILAVFDRETRNSFYGSSDGGRTWQELGGQGVLPLDRVFTVHLASDGSEIYAGTETGLYRSDIDPPWQWEKIADLNPVIAIEPVPGQEDTLYLATDMPDQDKGDIYRWQPPAAPKHLVSVESVPIALAPYPDPVDTIAVFVLLFGGEVVAVRPDGPSHFLGHGPSISFDLLAIPPVRKQPARLLLGSESGLLEYRESFDFR